ncbi:MAG TPA: DUF1028 domain-containing protein [Acidimicrobiales bacterium]
MTYSIVARDPATGELGIAVQTCFFGVGSIVPWARPGVGAVATQAMAEKAYGPRCLDALEAGVDAEEALGRAQGLDPMAVVRQVAVIGTSGGPAVATGQMCFDHAGHVVGDSYSAQANMISTPDVWGAMASEYEQASGPLARRLFAALEAGEAAGGDARGRMSAALLVVQGQPSDEPGGGVVVDLRVDRSDDPLGELGALLDAADAFAAYERASDQLFGGDPGAALRTIDQGLGLLPGEENLRFLRCGALVASGAVDDGVAELRALVAGRPSWEVIVRSFAGKGLLALPVGMTIDDALA